MNESTTPSHVWLITGCSSGFGCALARTLLSRGQRVVGYGWSSAAAIWKLAR